MERQQIKGFVFAGAMAAAARQKATTKETDGHLSVRFQTRLPKVTTRATLTSTARAAMLPM